MALTDTFELSEADSRNSAFESMFRSGELTDVEIKIGNTSFRAHRMILAVSFPFFRKLFTGKNKVKFTLQNVNPNAFECLLNFAYSGKISATSENVKELLITAHYLQNTKVRDSCFEFLSGQFSPENVLDLRTLGNNMACYEFVKKADAFIGKNFELLGETQAFVNATFEVLTDIISRGDIQVRETENIYKAIARWLKADSSRISKFMDLVICVQKNLPIPDVKCTNENDMEKQIIPRTLLDMPYYHEDVFGIYTVSRSASYNRVIHNYNGNTALWSMIAQHNESKSFTTVVSACGLIFAFTGDNLEFFDRHSWTICGVLPWEVKTRSGNAVTQGKKIFWFPNISDKECSVRCFNVEYQKWTEETSMSMKLISAGFVSLGKYIYILGGFTLTGTTNAAMTYEPYYKEFKDIAPMLEKRSNPGCAALNDKVYVCGGYGGKSTFLSTVEVYDPLTGHWKFISPMKNRWCNFSLVSFEGKLFVIGCQTTADDNVEIYDPEKNVWENGPAFPEKCNTLKAVVISA